MYDTIIFDLDGTLLNTLDDLYLAVNFALKTNGFLQVEKDVVRENVGNGARRLIEGVLKENSKAIVDKVLNSFINEYEEIKNDHTSPYEGVIELLTKLKEKNIKVGILSNKPDNATKELCEKWFKGLYIVGIGGSSERPLKPSSEAMKFILNEIGSQEEKTLYVGDQEVDVLTAKNGNVRLLGAGWGFRGKERLLFSGAETVIEKISDILDIIG